MEKLNPGNEYSWDELIDMRIIIKVFADKLDVNQDYLIYQTEFLKGVTSNMKIHSINAINKVIDRIKEINNANN